MDLGQCPLKVPGTSVQATDIEGGVALDFTTTGDVNEVRRRVAHMAGMHRSMGGGMMGSGMMGSGMMGSGMMGSGMMGSGMMGGGMMGSGMMGGGSADAGAVHGHAMMGDGKMGCAMMGAGGGASAEVRAEDLPQGARLVFTPKEVANLDALRKRVHEHAVHATAGSCPMMSMAEAAPPAGSAAPP